jgi:hypothetical protein
MPTVRPGAMPTVRPGTMPAGNADEHEVAV